MSFCVPRDHPRYHSLISRHLLEDGVLKGITNITGLIAHGRGEAFDYLLGEKSHDFASYAARAAAALLLSAKKPVISINGNTTVLVAREMIQLARSAEALLEINIFHDSGNRRELIAEHFRMLGAEVLGAKPDAVIPGLSSDRARVDSRGIYDADLILVALEDGDRTEVLIKGGKKVIAIDLNPLSRTPQMANVSIVDHVARALPLIIQYLGELRPLPAAERQAIIDSYDNGEVLALAEQAIRRGV